MLMESVVKTKETRDGVSVRVYKDGKYFFATIPFHNYFYIKTKDFEAYQEEMYSQFSFAIAKTEEKGQFTKIIFSNNFMRNKVRMFWEERCNTYEADILTNKRWLLDNNFKLHNENIPYTFPDIETDDRLPLQHKENGEVLVHESARILSFSSTDNTGESVYYVLEEDSDEDERRLLKQIIDYLSKYGVFSGWYSEKFDAPYIKQRCDFMGIDYSILDYINHVDYKELFIKYDKKSRGSYSLNNISNEVLNESKIDQAKGKGAIYNTWLNDKEQLKRYNIQDTVLLYKMNKKLMFMEVSMKRANNSGCHIRSTMYNSDSGDYLLMRAYKERGVIMPSKPTKEQLEERQKMAKISGGFTRCLTPGYHDTVEVWDFKSFYPMTIATFNVGPDTFIERLGMDTKPEDYPDYIVTPSNYNEERGTKHPRRLYKKERGVIADKCLYLVKTRDTIKYAMKEFEQSDPEKYKQMYLEQYALKTDANSIYGVLSFPPGRYYDWDVGDTVTTCCQSIIKDCYEKLEEWGCTVIGGDTDSTFVLLNKNTKEDIDAKFVEYFNELAKTWNVDEHFIVFEHEKTVSPMLFVKKKNYAYKESWGKVVIKGLECIKADANPLAAKLQKEFIMQIMDKKLIDLYWENLVQEQHDMVFNQEMSVEELTLIKSLTKMPTEYEGYIIDKKTKQPKIKADGTKQKKAIPAHVKLAERMMKQGVELYPGSKIPYIVILDKPILAISPAEYDKQEGEFEHKHKKKGEYIYEWEGGYEASYYWLRVIKPLIKVAKSYYGELPDWSWNLTAAQMNKMLK